MTAHISRLQVTHSFTCMPLKSTLPPSQESLSLTLPCKHFLVYYSSQSPTLITIHHPSVLSSPYINLTSPPIPYQLPITHSYLHHQFLILSRLLNPSASYYHHHLMLVSHLYLLTITSPSHLHLPRRHQPPWPAAAATCNLTSMCLDRLFEGSIPSPPKTWRIGGFQEPLPPLSPAIHVHNFSCLRLSISSLHGFFL